MIVYSIHYLLCLRGMCYDKLMMIAMRGETRSSPLKVIRFTSSLEVLEDEVGAEHSCHTGNAAVHSTILEASIS